MQTARQCRSRPTGTFQTPSMSLCRFPCIGTSLATAAIQPGVPSDLSHLSSRLAECASFGGKNNDSRLLAWGARTVFVPLAAGLGEEGWPRFTFDSLLLAGSTVRDAFLLCHIFIALRKQRVIDNRYHRLHKELSDTPTLRHLVPSN